VERFINMKGDGAPQAVDEMKCYMMGPHRVGIAKSSHWRFGRSLLGCEVFMLASGRNHMACIAGPRGGLEEKAAVKALFA